MQKLELRNILHEAVADLGSKKILDHFESGQVDPNLFLKNAIDSKAAFDRYSNENRVYELFVRLQIHKVYSTDFFSKMITFISSTQGKKNSRADLLTNHFVSQFVVQHKVLVSTFDIVDQLLLGEADFFDSERNFNITQAQENGNVLLQIIDEEKVSLKKIGIIIFHLEKLVESIYMVFEKIEKENFEEPAVISMIDSGSDINLSIKVPKKAANLIAQVFKQFWDLLVNRKSLRFNQKLNDVESTITIMAKIKEAEETGIIEPEMAEILRRGIRNNIQAIIEKNTLTKEIVLDTQMLSNRELLLEQTNQMHLLNQGEDSGPEERGQDDSNIDE